METMNLFQSSLSSSSACTGVGGGGGGGQEPLSSSSSSSSSLSSPWNSSGGSSFPVVAVEELGGSKGKKDNNTKCGKGSDFHHRSPSDNTTYFMEGQFSWLDDLLNEPDTLPPPTPVAVVPNKGHRRAASDTFAYLGPNTQQAFDIWDDDLSYQNKGSLLARRNINNHNFSMWARDNTVNLKGSNEATTTKLDKKPFLLEDKKNNNNNNHNNKNKDVVVSGHEMDESRAPILEGSAEGASSSSQTKPKTEARRNKQQSAHRSRLRKLQYIAHLERTVQALQSTGTKMSAELEFLDNQNMILNMENRALKHRLDSVSQEQLIKQFEHDMLEREVGRLQTVCQLQEQEQMLMHQQQQQNPRNRRPKSKDASTIRGQINNSQVQT